VRSGFCGGRQPRGFTLVEVLVSLVIVSVAILALGGFAVGVMGSGQVSRERLTAVHLAEQVMEYWRHDSIVSVTNDYAPLLDADCVLSPATSAPSYPVSTTCRPLSGARIEYTVARNQTAVNGPRLTDLNVFQPFSGAPTPMNDIVSVSWTHKGTARTVTLTHITSKQ